MTEKRVRKLISILSFLFEKSSIFTSSWIDKKKMKIKNIILYNTIIWLSLSCSVFAQNGLKQFLSSPNLKNANISISVKDLNTGKIIAEHRPDNLITPASTTKLLTTATALELLGPDFCFETRLQYDGNITAGVLNGNLYITGGGDPTLGSSFLGDSLFLAAWVDAVKKAGIQKINGAVIADASIFDAQGISPQWMWEDLGNYYAAGAYGIAIYDNSYKVVFRTGKAGTTPDILRTEPQMNDLRFKLDLKAANTNSDNAYFHGAPFCKDRFVTGTIPANRNEFVVKGDIPDPPTFAAELLSDALTKSGISVLLPPTATISTTKRARTTFYTQKSPPLKEIIKVTNFRSNNLYAEHLFRYLSLQTDSVASANTSLQIMKKYWQGRLPDTSEFILYDGCGLAPSNAISANFLVDLLTYEANKSPYKKEFMASLPTAGESGTIKNFLKGSRLQGKVQAKSGSIQSTQCYAGYIFLEDKTCVFAVMVNNFYGKRATIVDAIEKFLLSIK
jgi:D-alanyl-D-alanine carboxypeptidase/D-alanyl-D-alanine-endopeptidase (penicillin-binding protein 4)